MTKKAPNSKNISRPILGVSKQYQRVNPNCEPLTIEMYRSFPGNENLTDQQAQQRIDALTALVEIFFDYIRSQEQNIAEPLPQIGAAKKIAA